MTGSVVCWSTLLKLTAYILWAISRVIGIFPERDKTDQSETIGETANQTGHVSGTAEGAILGP